MMDKKTMTIGAVVIAALLIIGAFVYSNYSGKLNILGRKGNNTAADAGRQIAEKAVNYINQNILRGNGIASLIDVGEENGFYKIKFSLQGNQMESYITTDGKFFFPEVIKLEEANLAAVEKGTTLGSFSISEDEICKGGGKPIVYFFGDETCPHCRWEYPILNGVIKKFGTEISYHDNKDKQTETDVFNKYSSGGIPTIVLGCRYYRVGSGENGGEETETKNLTALICKITGNKPAEVCDGVKDLTSQIK